MARLGATGALGEVLSAGGRLWGFATRFFFIRFTFWSGVFPSISVIAAYRNVGFPLLFATYFTTFSVPPRRKASVLAAMALLVLLDTVVSIDFSR